ncbi:MAG: antitoxin [Thermoprotei archaeon]|nr:antitoxin [Thermoproteales archaeon]RLE96120.1 MAG: antitoxin [Thermoprotei archaeon]
MSVVIGVRVPRRLKEELERLGIDYASEIRAFLERRVREEKMRRVLEEIRRIRERIGWIGEDLAASFVREERDGR